MNVEVRPFLFGSQFTDGDGLSLDGADAMDRVVRAILELQAATFADGEGPILTAPDGGKWRVGVNNAGTLTTTSI